MEMYFEWKTPKGANIIMVCDVEHITRKTVSLDGWPCEVDCDDWRRNVTALTVNGAEQVMHDLDNVHKRIIFARKGRNLIGVELPADVVEAMYGEEERANAARMEREFAASARYEAHRAMMKKAMGY